MSPMLFHDCAGWRHSIKPDWRVTLEGLLEHVAEVGIQAVAIRQV